MIRTKNTQYHLWSWTGESVCWVELGRVPATFEEEGVGVSEIEYLREASLEGLKGWLVVVVYHGKVHGNLEGRARASTRIGLGVSREAGSRLLADGCCVLLCTTTGDHGSSKEEVMPSGDCEKIVWQTRGSKAGDHRCGL